MCKLTPQAARLMARLDVNQTVVRQRAELIAKREVGGELIWDTRELDVMGLEVHRTALKRHREMVDRDTILLRAMGWSAPRYAMPGVVFNGDIKVTLEQLRNNDAHLWDDLIAAEKKISVQ